MGEEIGVLTQAHQVVGQQFATVVVGLSHEVAHLVQSKLLADDGGGLKRVPVRRIQAVQASLHEALDRAGNFLRRAFLGVAQQLFQE